MTYDPQKHHRRSVRLRNYDYSFPGAYYVTICVNHRKCLLGIVINDEVILNGAGKMVEYWWNEIARKFPLVDLDEHIVMPNHIHGIIKIVDRRHREKELFHQGKSRDQISEALIHLPARCEALSEIIKWFKTMTTNAYINGVKEQQWQHFNRHFWQMRYYEHVIKGLKEFLEIRRYMRLNPKRWSLNRKK